MSFTQKIIFSANEYFWLLMKRLITWWRWIPGEKHGGKEIKRWSWLKTAEIKSNI